MYCTPKPIKKSFLVIIIVVAWLSACTKKDVTIQEEDINKQMIVGKWQHAKSIISSHHSYANNTVTDTVSYADYDEFRQFNSDNTGLFHGINLQIFIPLSTQQQASYANIPFTYSVSDNYLTSSFNLSIPSNAKQKIDISPNTLTIYDERTTYIYGRVDATHDGADTVKTEIRSYYNRVVILPQ